MAEVLEITKSHDSGLYDIVTGLTCETEKVVEVTDDCPISSDKRRVIFLYTRDRNGLIVQITHPYEDEEYMGVHIHFHVDQLDSWINMAPRNDTYGSLAKKLGLSKQDLRELIKQNAPSA